MEFKHFCREYLLDIRLATFLVTLLKQKNRRVDIVTSYEFT